MNLGQLVTSFIYFCNCYSPKAQKMFFVNIILVRTLNVYHLQPRVSQRYRESCGKKIEVRLHRQVRAVVTWLRGQSFHCCKYQEARSICIIPAVEAVRCVAASAGLRWGVTVASRAMPLDP